ncbi:MAG: hypothetical protein U5K70_01195 [Halodesulfurarchaeum sp.]|nr:hypothetical protein [Halodesulfurarchaeum sp.]
MATRNESTTTYPTVDAWRGRIALIFAFAGTIFAFLLVSDFQPLDPVWVPSAVGLVGLKVPYTGLNETWYLVRILLGVYITFVFVIIAGQMIGTWRRLLMDDGGEA